MYDQASVFAVVRGVREVFQINVRRFLRQQVNGNRIAAKSVQNERVIILRLLTLQAQASIAEHDIGFAGEEKISRSRDLTITNKILHYLLAGLAVVASDTAGQREVAEAAGAAVSLYPCGDAAALARELNSLLASPDRLKASKAAALHAAEIHYCWEREVPSLLESIEITSTSWK